MQFIFLAPSFRILTGSVAVSDRVEVTPVQSEASRPSKRHKSVVISPKKGDRVQYLKIRVIRGTRTNPAGIPLDQAGLRFADQGSTLFNDYKSLRIDFVEEDGKWLRSSRVRTCES
jgi:hypothetical protein